MTQTQPPKPDLTEHEEEVAPFDDVLRRLLSAKPTPVKTPAPPKGEED